MSNKVESKEQCPKCRDEGYDIKGMDNLVTFADSHVQHCFRHGYMGKDGTFDNEDQAYVKPTKKTVGEIMTTGLILDGEYADLKSRGISKRTCEYFGYQVHKEKQVHIANYYDDAGNVKMQQLRTADKQFPIVGSKEFNNTLWGLHKSTPDERVFVVITEGHIDALSVAEVFSCKYPVCSLPNGAGSAYKVLRDNLPLLSLYKYVVLAFDQDAVGREATESCLSLFAPGKVRVVNFGKYKDANELIQVGKHSELRDLIYNAKTYLPPSILTGDALVETLKDYKTKTIDWPWKTFTRNLQPIYVPGIYSIAGRSGVGKTVLMADLIKAEIAKGKKIGIISLEETVQKLLLKITSLITGIDIRSIHNRLLSDDEIDQCRQVASNIVTYNHKNYGSDLNTICDSLPYIAQALDCEIIIFDNLSFSATSTTDDERRAIDQAMVKLMNSSVKYGYTLLNICHLNDDDNNAKDASIRGTRGVLMYSSYVIHIDRNTESENEKERNTLHFYIKKDRESGEDVGKHLMLHYNTKTRTLEDM